MAKKTTKLKILNTKSLPTLRNFDDGEDELPQPDHEKEEEKLNADLIKQFENSLEDLKTEKYKILEPNIKPKEWCTNCNILLENVRNKDWKCSNCGKGWSFM
ncbi:MAG: hypothetical protein AABY22_29810 [Nanoarchaeota archaeon]